MSFDYVESDTATVLERTCRQPGAGTIINLTGCSVLIRWISPKTDALIEHAMTVADAPGGKVRYQFVAGELLAPKMEFEIRITDGLTNQVTILDPIVWVGRPRIAA